jgi:hypothetical protein
MYVSNVEKQGEGEIVNLEAVVSGSDENKSFANATPSASLRIWISNPSAQGVFEQGTEYYLDFTKAEA